MPSWTKVAIDQWAAAAALTTGYVFHALNNRHELTGAALLPQNIMEAVVKYGRADRRDEAGAARSPAPSQSWRIRGAPPSSKFNCP